MLKNIILNTKEQYQKAIDWLKDYFTLAEGIIALNNERNTYKNGEDCFEDLQNCNNNYEKCPIYNAKNKMEGVLN